MLPDYMSTGSATSADVRWIVPAGWPAFSTLSSHSSPQRFRAPRRRRTASTSRHQESLSSRLGLCGRRPAMLMRRGRAQGAATASPQAISASVPHRSDSRGALLVVAMSMQIAFAQSADRLETTGHALGAPGRCWSACRASSWPSRRSPTILCLPVDVAPRWTGYRVRDCGQPRLQSASSSGRNRMPSRCRDDLGGPHVDSGRWRRRTPLRCRRSGLRQRTRGATAGGC